MANFFSNLTFFRRAVVAGVLVVSGAANAANEKYCLALRGNGESQPAHWGALASLVEKTGLPYAQSGGSSASISLFILDTIASNPWVHNQRDENLRAALLLKSLFGMGHYITKTQEAKNALTLLKDLGKVKKLFDDGVFNMLWEIGKSSDLDSVMAKQREIRALVKTLRDLGIGDAPRYSVLINSLAAMSNPLAGIPMSVLQARRLKFYAADLHQAISVLGAFDAESDGTLFFRDGIVNFEKFGLRVGRLITFLAGGKLFQPTASAAFEQFVNLCAPIHKGLTWQELTAKEPRCQTNLDAALDAFFAQPIDWEKENVALRNAGAAILSLPSTAVLVDSDSPKSAYKEAKAAYNRYHGLLDRGAAENFRVTNNHEIKFGYWGPSRVLDRANARRSAAFIDSKGRVIDLTQDAKSARFLALGPTTWREVMRLSPAEPGLASLQPMKIDGRDAYSAGGWADLHPVLVLKAIGCENVVYVTRKGGESLFGQGVAKRLLGFDREWEKLRTSEPEAKKANQLLNATGDLEEMAKNPKSDWNRLYNVANPESSYMKSVAAADVVLCTDWDRWDVKSEVLELVTESYKAQYVLTPTQAKVTSTPSLDAILADLRSGGAEFVRDLYSVTEGKPDWVGCRPPQARGATMMK
jgi:hypothetical protein